MGLIVQTEVPLGRVADMLCCALEGGSNYWYRIEEFIEPDKINPEIEKEWGEYRQYSYPLSDGGALVISDYMLGEDEDDMTTATLNLESIAKGLKIMAEKYPTHFQDMVQENDDAETGDVFLQCCLFGDLVYS